MVKWLKRRLIGEAIALDEAGNVLLLDGDAHVTISAHCGAQIEAKRPCWFCRALCWVLGKFFPGHCTRAWYSERGAWVATHKLPGGGK